VPADGLVITTGTYSVATDDQLARVQSLEQFAETAGTIIDQLALLNASLGSAELRAAGAPASAFLAEREISDALATLARAAASAASNAKLTRTAMHYYEVLARTVEKEADDWVGEFARLVGHFSGPMVFAGFAAAILLMGTISPRPASAAEDAATNDPQWEKFLAAHPRLLNNPEVAEAIRLVADGLDDEMLAAMGIPEPTIQKLKDSGLAGPELAAAILVAVGHPLGKLRESDVRLAAHKSVTGPGVPPAGWADRISRIPDTTSNGGYQIRIDKYVDAHGKRSFEVYLSGTQTFSTSRTTVPFDFTSDTNGLAALPNGALAAVEKAMTAAGISRTDPVNITGHSEGGLVAHEIAASRNWNVKVALEAGSPAAHTELPGGTTEVALQHNEDIVPSLGGMRDDGDKTIVVRATAFPDGTVPTGDAVPAHNSLRYEHTAHLLDGAASSVINDAKAKASDSEKHATGTVTTTLYRAERVWKDGK
jgi:hypothetical protein